jgi:polyphenol oxidase
MNAASIDANPDELAFELPGSGRALFTTRAHGNMSSVGGLDHEHGYEARERLRAQLGLRRLARGYQVHGTTVLRSRTDADIPEPDATATRPLVQADGHATSVAGAGAMVLTADCLPVALGAAGAVAMVHAGWRGLAAGVLEEGVWALRELAGASDIVAIVGPGAGPCCYEVGPEVHAAIASTSGGAIAVASTTGATRVGGSPIDLKALARGRLLAAGVDRVHDVGLCTICDERFFSHRRESTRAGRQAGVAWLS